MLTLAETLIVSLDDFSTYLNDELDDLRATQILTLAQKLCETIVSPLPDGAEIVILDVAQRAYANPTNVRNSELGLYSEGAGPYSDGTPGFTSGGLWLTANNISTLERLAGAGHGSGAFTVDMTPTGAGQGLPWWDTGGWYFTP